MRKTPMTPEAAARIQSHAERSGQNQGFKSRAQAASARNQAPTTSGRPSPHPHPGTKANRK